MTLDEIYNNVLDKPGRVEMLYQMLIVACSEAGYQPPVMPKPVDYCSQLASAIASASPFGKIEIIKAVRQTLSKIKEESSIPVNPGLKEAVWLCNYIFPGDTRSVSSCEVEEFFERHPHILKAVFP